MNIYIILFTLLIDVILFAMHKWQVSNSKQKTVTRKGNIVIYK